MNPVANPKKCRDKFGVSHRSSFENFSFEFHGKERLDGKGRGLPGHSEQGRCLPFDSGSNITAQQRSRPRSSTKKR
jgi:hypothetical protein